MIGASTSYAARPLFTNITRIVIILLHFSFYNFWNKKNGQKGLQISTSEPSSFFVSLSERLIIAAIQWIYAGPKNIYIYIYIHSILFLYVFLGCQRSQSMTNWTRIVDVIVSHIVRRKSNDRWQSFALFFFTFLGSCKFQYFRAKNYEKKQIVYEILDETNMYS